MNTALVISSSPQSKEIIRSDMVAAKVLQQAIKDGRGEDVLAPRASDVRSESAAKVEPKRVEATEKKLEPRAVAKDAAALGDSRPAYLADMRDKVGEMTRALADLKQAFENISDYRSLIMESDSATAIAFAGNVLGNVERTAEQPEPVEEPQQSADDAEVAAPVNGLKGSEREDAIVTEAQMINRVESGAGDDGIVARGGVVRHISGGEGSDGIAIQAQRAVDVSGGSGDDMIGIEAVKAWGVSGGAGDDKIHVMGARVGNVSGGEGDDTVSVQGLSVRGVDAGSGNDRLAIIGKNITNVSDGAGDDHVTIKGDRLSGLQSSAGDDVYNLNVGTAKMSLREGMGNDVVNLADGAHLQFALGDPAMMQAGAVSAVWEGENLSLNFENGDSLVINNAANAGSISMRAGGTELTLMPPKTPAGAGLLDVAV